MSEPMYDANGELIGVPQAGANGDKVEFTGVSVLTKSNYASLIPTMANMRPVASLASQYWTPKAAGDFALGRLTGWGEGKSKSKSNANATYAQAQMLGTITEGGKEGLPGAFIMGQNKVTSTLLERNIPIGTVVKITYKGKITTGSGNTLSDFELQLMEEVKAEDFEFSKERAKNGLVYLSGDVTKIDAKALNASYSDAHNFATQRGIKADMLPGTLMADAKSVAAFKALLETIVQYHDDLDAIEEGIQSF